MKTGDGFQQCYNAQAAVDDEFQVIVAQDVDNEQNDHHQLTPMVDQIEANLGERTKQVSADAGTARRRTSKLFGKLRSATW